MQNDLVVTLHFREIEDAYLAQAVCRSRKRDAGEKPQNAARAIERKPSVKSLHGPREIPVFAQKLSKESNARVTVPAEACSPPRREEFLSAAGSAVDQVLSKATASSVASRERRRRAVKARNAVNAPYRSSAKNSS